MTQANPAPTAEQLINAWAEAHGVTMSATFIPYSQSRNAAPQPGQDKPWRSLNWRVALAKGGRVFLETDYSAGEAHAPAYKLKEASDALRRSGYSAKRAKDDLIAWEIENGYPGGYSFSGIKRYPSNAAPILPDLASVLHSLSMDSSVLDEGGFEPWAESLGYDTDSRKAESIYRACLEIALKMRAAFGDEGLSDLRDACEDY